MDTRDFFQLQEHPYQTTANPRFLYLSDQVKEALAKVQYMTTHRIGPLYMSGPIGSGKTTIMRRIHGQLADDETYVPVLLAVPPNITTPNAFLRLVMEAFKVKTERAYDRSLKNFEEYLLAQYQAEKIPVLLVDQAESMTRPLLRLIHFLLNFETDTEKLVQIVLSGQTELAHRIYRYRELDSRMFPIAMTEMLEPELRTMLEFRWDVAAGGKQQVGRYPFDEDAYTAIHRASRGLPRDAVKLADEALRHLLLRDRKTATAADIEKIASEFRPTKQTKINE